MVERGNRREQLCKRLLRFWKAAQEQSFPPGNVLTKRERSAITCSMLYLFLCYESHGKAVRGIQYAGRSVILINSRDGSARNKLGAFYTSIFCT